jgi:glycosyltransferase involved in cell wall biosynthesis
VDQKFTHGEIEIIIVNDSGDTQVIKECQHVDRVRTINTHQRERCMARNAGAAVARGKYLWFLDDDDWILPDAFNEFWSLASDAPEAHWLYGGVRIVDGNGTLLAERNSGLSGNCFAQIMGGAWAPIQSSIIKADAFFEVGGFNPLIIGTEDLDLCRRISMLGKFANTEAPVSCLFRGSLWNTSTDYLRGPVDTRRSRDELLDIPGAYSRMHSSAGNAYWYGRTVRVYLSTINFNLQQRKILMAIERAILTATSALHAGGALFSKQFWSGVRADHVPGSLHFVMMDLEKSTEKEPFSG